jgi:hypothetical protein
MLRGILRYMNIHGYTDRQQIYLVSLLFYFLENMEIDCLEKQMEKRIQKAEMKD